VEGCCEDGNELSGKTLSSCATGGFSRRAQLHGVSYHSVFLLLQAEPHTVKSLTCPQVRDVTVYKPLLNLYILVLFRRNSVFKGLTAIVLWRVLSCPRLATVARGVVSTFSHCGAWCRPRLATVARGVVSTFSHCGAWCRVHV
jgi:hypothetical protein